MALTLRHESLALDCKCALKTFCGEDAHKNRANALRNSDNPACRDDFHTADVHVHALKKSISSPSTLRRGSDYGTDPSVLVEVKENGVIRDGIRVVKNAFTKKL